MKLLLSSGWDNLAANYLMRGALYFLWGLVLWEWYLKERLAVIRADRAAKRRKRDLMG